MLPILSGPKDTNFLGIWLPVNKHQNLTRTSFAPHHRDENYRCVKLSKSLSNWTNACVLTIPKCCQIRAHHYHRTWPSRTPKLAKYGFHSDRHLKGTEKFVKIVNFVFWLILIVIMLLYVFLLFFNSQNKFFWI